MRVHTWSDLLSRCKSQNGLQEFHDQLRARGDPTITRAHEEVICILTAWQLLSEKADRFRASIMNSILPMLVAHFGGGADVWGTSMEDMEVETPCCYRETRGDVGHQSSATQLAVCVVHLLFGVASPLLLSAPRTPWNGTVATTACQTLSPETLELMVPCIVLGKVHDAGGGFWRIAVPGSKAIDTFVSSLGERLEDPAFWVDRMPLPYACTARQLRCNTALELAIVKHAGTDVISRLEEHCGLLTRCVASESTKIPLCLREETRQAFAGSLDLAAIVTRILPRLTALRPSPEWSAWVEIVRELSTPESVPVARKMLLSVAAGSLDIRQRDWSTALDEFTSALDSMGPKRAAC